MPRTITTIKGVGNVKTVFYYVVVSMNLEAQGME